MTYQEATDFLFSSLPMYQRVGNKAFKADLNNIIRLCEALGNPHTQFKSVHVAGTNGKGSASHIIASVLQEAGYKTGLYTSPHLKSFTERIRINGRPIEEAAVASFVENIQENIQEIAPSFFEMTVALAFDHFARQKVDVAVIEVGLGGRLDSTNIITPEACLITNIGLDHTDTLGDSLDKIAFEKAGIIKTRVPVVIGTWQQETAPVFQQVAKERKAPLHFAPQSSGGHPQYELDLKGNYQQKNLPGVLALLRILNERGWGLSDEIIRAGLGKVTQNTGLKGRWQTLRKEPLTICDTGHNIDGIKALVNQINGLTYEQLFLVLGFVNDKQVGEILGLFPKEAHYVFCQSAVPRAMPLAQLRQEAEKLGLEADYVADVNEALAHAGNKASAKDLIFVGGSTFVVAELNEL